MGDADMNIADGADTFEEGWSRYYSQYHGKGWGADSILFRSWSVFDTLTMRAPVTMREKYVDPFNVQPYGVYLREFVASVSSIL